MNAKTFIDTNVLICATAKNDERMQTALGLLSEGGIISVQVLNEFVSAARRKLNWAWPEVMEALAAFRVLCPDVRPIDVTTHEAALDVAQRERFHFYDLLIIAAALDAGCSILLTENLQHGRVIAGRLTVRNPFAL